MLPTERLDQILTHAEKLQTQMNGELPPERFVELSKEYAALSPMSGGDQRLPRRDR